ncbi:MAG: hypothetical protein VYB61_05335 [Verrucomicrobiota bacterium]|nr:hypothetical protein [Verrucomicrobiota bacterium]
MAFYYVYKSLAHPERDRLVQPVTIEERLAHVKAAGRQLDTRIPWLADTMSNDLKHALGDRPNSEFIISPEGKILVARSWSDPDRLRADLEKMVGKTKTVTNPSDLDRKPKSAAISKIASGVVPRVEKPEGSMAVIARPVIRKEADKAKQEIFYVKLRAEADRSLMMDGTGKLHLGFHLDPVHTVHWNNLADPLRFEFKSIDGVDFSMQKGVSPKVKASSDIDPREFLLDVKGAGGRIEEKLTLKVSYFACDDEEGWCRAVSHLYEIELRRDRDAGSVRSARANGGFDRRRPGGNGRGPQGRRPELTQLFSRMDSNGDGVIARNEARGPMIDRFDRLDVDGNGSISKTEMKTHFERMRGSGNRSRPPRE